MQTFQPNQIVKCINNGRGRLNLTRGKTYKVLSYHPDDDIDDDDCISIFNDKGIKALYFCYRFAAVAPV